MKRRQFFVLPALAIALSAHAEPLGRLFLDAQQRARLDLQRQRNPGFQPNATEDRLTLNGEVRSSNGRRTRWINGEADWNGTGPNTGIPIGDTLNQSTGQRESVIGAGQIRIRRGPP